jgi:hypothetical protein
MGTNHRRYRQLTSICQQLKRKLPRNFRLELAAEFRRQMDLNVIGPIIATQAFGPLLGSDPSLKGKPGRIVMISSENGNPLMSAYSASKHAIEIRYSINRREPVLISTVTLRISSTSSSRRTQEAKPRPGTRTA